MATSEFYIINVLLWIITGSIMVGVCVGVAMFVRCIYQYNGENDHQNTEIAVYVENVQVVARNSELPDRLPVAYIV
jgi:MFS superfamily sulfate permease-like transporter